MTSASPNAPELVFDQGTLLLSGFNAAGIVRIFPQIPWVWDERVSKHRVDGIWYSSIKSCLSRIVGDLNDQVGEWSDIHWPDVQLPPLRPEQEMAVSNWTQGGANGLLANGLLENGATKNGSPKRGVVVMPTGTGKTIVALSLAHRLRTSCLFVAPVRDLMYQWHRRILMHLGYDAGIIGDNVFKVKPVSVTTYDSAAIHMPRLGNQFGLIVFDECHHLPGNFYRDAAFMSAAPCRLGLTATPDRSDGRQVDLIHLIGPTVYEMRIDEAAGKTLADYEVIRIPVTLSESEQARYDSLSHQVSEYVYQRRQDDDQFNWQQLCQETNADPEARSVLKAYRFKQAIENRAEEKLRVLEDLFRLHVGEPIIIFVGSNSMARDVSLRFLIPCLLSHCGKQERLEILTGLEDGSYPAVVANQILDEGVDLPDVNVAIVIGGSSSVRQAKQRLGRVLRKSKFGRATLYEVVLSGTSETKRSRDRRKNDAYANVRFRRSKKSAS